MKIIYVLVSYVGGIENNVTIQYPVLEQKGEHGWDWHGWLPAFLTKESAQKYISNLDKHKGSKLSIVGLQIHD